MSERLRQMGSISYADHVPCSDDRLHASFPLRKRCFEPFYSGLCRLTWRGSVLFELIIKTLNRRIAGMLTTSLLLAGVGTLAPTSVRAFSTCTFGGLSPTCFPDFVFDRQDDKVATLKILPTVGMGTLQFKIQSGVWVMDVDFIPDLEAVTALGMLEYDVEIDPITAGNFDTFDEGGLAIIGPTVGAREFKVKKFATGLPMVMADEMNPQAAASFASGLKKINVRDEYMVTKGSINSFQNSFSQQPGEPPSDRVPGPLPLLGAGAAFGFSRRLRTRVLAARGA